MTQRYATAFVSISVMLSTIMQVLDTTIANVALPHMQGALGATSDQITWVLTSYIVATAIMTLPVGYLARRFGRRRLLLWSVAGFTVASLLCGQAESLEEMVLWRLLQGVCGASLVPLSQSTLLDSFPVEKHAGAMSIWGTGVMLGPILGPTLGGWLTDFYSWRWVFLINLPIGMASFAGIYFFVKETPITRQRFDLFGFSLLALCVGTLQLMLDRGELVMWFESIEVKLYVITCVFALYFFVVHSKTSDDTLFSPGLFRDRNFVSGISFIFFIGIILLATMVLLPPFMQVWKGYPVVTTGLLLMPRGVGTMLTMMMAGRLLCYFDGRAVILCGMCLLSYSLYLMAGFNLQVSQFDIITSGVIQGLGLGLVFIPATTLAYATLSPSLRDEGTALFNLARNMGTSVGVSIVMAMLSRNLWINQQDIAARLTFDASRLPGLPGGTELGQMPAAIISEVSRQAAEIAFVNDFYLLMWINLLAMPLVLLLRNPARRPSGAAG